MSLNLTLVANGGLCAETDSVAASDTTGIITATASTISFNALPNNVAYHRSIDYGVDYFTTNFGWNGTASVSAQTGTTTKAVFIGVSDSLFEENNASNLNELALRFGNTAANTTEMNFFVVVRESSTNNNGTATAQLANGTYYYNVQHTTAVGGQYGAFCVKGYTDSAHTSYSWQSWKALSAASPGYQYFYPLQSTNTALSGTVTGTSGDITPINPAEGIVLTPNGTTIIETDPASKVTVYPNCISVSALSIASATNGATHVSLDYGTDYFGDYEISIVLNITTLTLINVGTSFLNVLCVTNGAADGLLATAMQGVVFDFSTTSSLFKAYIQENVGVTPSYSSALSVDLSTNRPITLVLKRAGSTLTLKAWNELELTNFVGTSQIGSTVTWTGRATTPYRYLMPFTTHLIGSTNRNSTFTVGGLKISVPTPTTGTIAFTEENDTVAVAAEISNAATIAFTEEDDTVAVTGAGDTTAAITIAEEDDTVAVVGEGAPAASISITEEDDTVAAAGSSGAPSATILINEADDTVAAAAEISNAASVAFTEDNDTVAVAGSFTVTTTEYFSITVRDRITGAKLTGLTGLVLISAVDDVTGYRFDFTDNQFRAVSAIPTLSLAEYSEANNPGYYRSQLTTTNWNSEITVTIEYDDGTVINSWVESSVEYIYGTRVKVSSRTTVADIPTASENALAIEPYIPTASENATAVWDKTLP